MPKLEVEKVEVHSRKYQLSEGGLYVAISDVPKKQILLAKKNGDGESYSEVVMGFEEYVQVNDMVRRCLAKMSSEVGSAEEPKRKGWWPWSRK